FEGLAEHYEAAGARVTRTEMQVREPALAPSAAPLHRDHHQVKRVRALDLEPARAAPSRFVRRLERLGHQPLVAARKRVGIERLCLFYVLRHEGWRQQPGGKRFFERFAPIARTGIHQCLTVAQQAVEEE